MELGEAGVWWSGSWKPAEGLDDVAAELEFLGYGALWSSGGFEPGLSARFERLLASTRQAVVASGIVSIWTSPAPVLAVEVAALEARHPGRFLLGLGVSHAPLAEHYARPYPRMVEYLDALDTLGASVQRDRRVLAALRPRMLELAATRASGAHPYLVPVEHTARARELLGAGARLAPEVTAVIEPDRTESRRQARAFTQGYLTLPNYVDNLRWLGFGDEDFAGGGSDRLVDALVAQGDVEAVAERAREHLEAGADHVAVQVLADLRTFPLRDYRALAPALLAR